MAAARPDRSSTAPLRVTLITEGTYPYVVGGVSTWCQELILGLPDIHWDVVPITAGGQERESLFDLPTNATVRPGIDLWGPPPLRRRQRRHRTAGGGTTPVATRSIPSELARLALGPTSDPQPLCELFASFKRNPTIIGRAFRSGRAWYRYLATLYELTSDDATHLFKPVPITALDAAQLWQTLYWLASTATVDVPPSDVVLCTAAGWPAAIASWTTCERRTPVVVAEHGVYVREAYLESVRTNRTPGQHFAATRLATGMARLAYSLADRVTPVSEGHHAWEQHLGADPTRIDTIVNGVDLPGDLAPPVGSKTVVSIGRIDPLKDIATALRTARIVCDIDDDVTFLHYGPVSAVNETYNEMCLRLHSELGLGERFRFMGGTSDPRGAVREAAVYLSTSISEGLPLSVMEAMSEARPVVATDVGGCAELVTGCGVLAPSGDAHALAASICYLLDQPDAAANMGRRGRRRAERRFSKAAQLTRYREVLSDVAA